METETSEKKEDEAKKTADDEMKEEVNLGSRH